MMDKGMKRIKKGGIIYKDDPDSKARDLEAYLFGRQDAGTLFEHTDAGADDDEAIADMLRKGASSEGGSLFFEDKRAAADISDADEDADEDADKDADEDQEEPLGVEDEDTSEEHDEGGATGNGGTKPASAEEEEEEEEDSEEAGLKARRLAGSKASGRRPVWIDPSDAKLKVNIAGQSRLRKLRTTEKSSVINGVQYEAALRKQHTVLNPRTSWAKRDTKATGAAGKRQRAAAASGYGAADSSDEDEEQEEDADVAAEEMMRQAGGLMGPRRSGGRLAPGSIETSRLKDANQHDPHEAVVRSVEFHPGGQLLMTAGLDKRIRIFQVDGVLNSRVQSIFLEDTPVHKAAFAMGGSQIIAVGRRPHFYVYDMAGGQIERVAGPTGCSMKSLESFAVTQGGEDSCGPAGPLAAFLGDQGHIPIVSLRSRQWVTTLKMSGSVRSASFSADGNELVTAGGDGILYSWDMRTRRCMGQMVDCGNKDSASLAMSRDNRYLATGSASGVVNLYRQDQCWGARGAGPASNGGLLRPATPTPLKEAMNITTTVDTLSFSPDGQILAFASRMKKDSMRLMHLPSMTVFSNWPTGRSPLHFVHCLAFSPNGGFLAIGNARGRVLLYRLHHYVDA